LDDDHLARRILESPDRSAGAEEGELCRRYLKRVEFFGRRHLGARDRAEDLAQDVLMIALEKLRAGEVRNPERIGSFILGVARRRVMSFRRTLGRESQLDASHDMAAAAAEGVRHGEVSANVNDALVARAKSEGVTVREYRLEAGDTVPCSATPEDLVSVRLAGDFSTAGELTLELDFLDLSSGKRAPTSTRSVLADRDAGAIVLIFPGSEVRSYPRSRWTMTVRDPSKPGQPAVGPFVMDHTP